METVGVTAGETAGQPVTDKGKHSVTQQHGLVTPEGTPAPEPARILADNARRDAQPPNANAQQNQQNVESKTEPEGPSGDAGGKNVGDKEGEGDGNTTPTKEQIEAVKRVMECGKEEYRKILGLQDTYASKIEERQAAMDAFRELGCLVHEKYNKAENARNAFLRVVDAAKALEIEDDDILDMRNWDGESIILDVRLNADGKWEPRNNDESSMDIASTDWHKEVYREATGVLGSLANPQYYAECVKALDEANDTIKKRNKEIGLREDQFLINYNVFIDTFKKAAPYQARLRSHPDDEEARREVESINDWLRKYNDEHSYPKDWVIQIPEPPNKQTASRGRTASQASKRTASRGRTASRASKRTASQTGERTASQTRHKNSTEPKGQAIRTAKFLTVTEKDGYVLDRGIEKEIDGYMPAGFGHQLLLKEDGNQLDIYELVRASKFGKKFIERNKEGFLKGKEIRLGTARSLEGKSLSTARIGGVASVRRNPKNEPRDGWEREAKTIALMSFDRSTRFKWYLRSILGQQFGQEKVDEELNKYRKRAGQKGPLPPRKRGTRKKRKDLAAIASDDEDEGSISVEDTSGEEDEEEEDEYEDEGNSDDDKVELEVLMEQVRKLQKSMKKKQEKPRKEGSAGSPKSKSKKNKAK